MKNKGFTLVELILVLAIAGIMLSIAIPNLIKYRKDYIFNDYASQIEYLVKYAKIYAMERSRNIGICVNNNLKTMAIFNIGPDRGASTCPTTNTPLCVNNNHTAPCIINRIEISENYISVDGSNYGSVVKIDPRGIAIYPGNGGNICITDGANYSKVIISKTGVRTEKGLGGCS